MIMDKIKDIIVILTSTLLGFFATIQSDGVTVKYKYTKYWTTDE